MVNKQKNSTFPLVLIVVRSLQSAVPVERRTYYGVHMLWRFPYSEFDSLTESLFVFQYQRHYLKWTEISCRNWCNIYYPSIIPTCFRQLSDLLMRFLRRVRRLIALRGLPIQLQGQVSMMITVGTWTQNKFGIKLGVTYLKEVIPTVADSFCQCLPRYACHATSLPLSITFRHNEKRKTRQFIHSKHQVNNKSLRHYLFCTQQQHW